MASFLDQNFQEEEDEDDFNPQAEIGSDDEGDEKPQTTADGDDEPPARKERRPARSGDDEDEIKEEDDEKDGLVGFGKDGDDNVDVEAEDADEDEEEDGARRGGDEDDEEDEEEEEEDDEDDDIEGQPSRKRRKKHRRNQFVDVEAEVDEDEEEEPEEDEDLPADEMHPDDLQELPPGADRDDRKHRELDLQREREFQLDVEETAARLKERYGRQSRMAQGTGAVVPQHLLLPGAEDPRIWRYKCRPGKEREVILSLNERIVARQQSREPIQILSAFERGGPMAGAIYVEARRQEDIAAALLDLTHVFLGTAPLMIRLEEMPDLLRTKKSKQLEAGMYVRLRRGHYQGDLAQVYEVETNGTDVTLRIVPRLDYGLNEDANAPIEAPDPTGKRKRVGKGPLAAKPAPRLFSETEARKKHHKYLSRGGGGLSGANTWTYQGKTYENGFLIETFRVNALQIENVNPTLEEVTKFAAGGEDGSENLDLAALAATLKQSTATDYLPGDRVELFRGEQKGVTGRAVEVYGDVVKIKVDAVGALLGQKVEASIKDLRKLFRDGDHVKVIGGSKYFDEVGMVVKTKDDRVTIVTDSTKQEVTVFSKDLREASDSGGNVSGSKFALFDLVQLDASTVGCVIKVDRESLRVLDQTGDVRNLLPSAISNRLERRNGAVATDHDGNEMKIDDGIKEFSGEQKQGRVLHLHRNFVFAQNRERSENAGVFVARHNNVIVVAAKGGKPAGQNGIDLTKMNPAFKQNGASGMGGAAMAPPQQKGRDRWIGKSVKIRTGPNKGLIGIVKDAGDLTAKVELHGKNKQITISKEQLTPIDAHTGTAMKGQGLLGALPARTPGPGNYGRTPFAGGTAASGRTPAYAMAGGASRTPAWKQDAGARTPAFGGATSYGGFGGSTAYGGGQTSYGGSTAYGQPSYGGASVRGGNPSTWSANPSARTPAHNPGASGGLEAPTPGFNSAPTPGNYADQPTPGGFRGAAQFATPAAYNTPGGFPETPGAGFDDDEPRYD